MNEAGEKKREINAEWTDNSDIAHDLLAPESPGHFRLSVLLNFFPLAVIVFIFSHCSTLRYFSQILALLNPVGLSVAIWTCVGLSTLDEKQPSPWTPDQAERQGIVDSWIFEEAAHRLVSSIVADRRYCSSRTDVPRTLEQVSNPTSLSDSCLASVSSFSHDHHVRTSLAAGHCVPGPVFGMLIAETFCS